MNKHSPTAKTPRTAKAPKPAAKVAKKSAARASASHRASPQRRIDPDARQVMIAEAAYFIAEKREFGGGNPLDDWLAAEQEIDRLLGD